MEKITHQTLKVNNINMHIASLGNQSDPPILFLHGFPELWYSWRHQMLHLSAKGYRTIAPDLRGYGDTDTPPSVSSYSVLHIVGDLVALLDALGFQNVFVVGHDWGAIVAWWFCLLRPDRVKALVNTSVVFQPRNPMVKTVEGYRKQLGDGFYMCRFQEPGEAEKGFGSVETKSVFKAFLSSRDPKPLTIPRETSMEEKLKVAVDLPSWLTEADIDYYANKYEKTGFTGGLNYYRAMDLSWELTAPWTGAEIKVPVKFVIGDLDLTYNFPGVKEFIGGGGFKKFVPLLDEVVVMEGVAHWINQEKAEEISKLIYDYFNKF